MTKGRDTSNLERLKAFRAKLAAQSKNAPGPAVQACPSNLPSLLASAQAPCGKSAVKKLATPDPPEMALHPCKSPCVFPRGTLSAAGKHT